MIQLAQLINAESIKYIALGFVALTVGALGYKLGYDRGHIPKSEMCAEARGRKSHRDLETRMMQFLNLINTRSTKYLKGEINELLT